MNDYTSILQNHTVLFCFSLKNFSTSLKICSSANRSCSRNSCRSSFTSLKKRAIQLINNNPAGKSARNILKFFSLSNLPISSRNHISIPEFTVCNSGGALHQAPGLNQSKFFLSLLNGVAFQYFAK